MIDAGVIGFKCFMGPSGIEEFPHVSNDDIDKTLKILEGTNSVLAVSSHNNQKHKYTDIFYIVSCGDWRRRRHIKR